MANLTATPHKGIAVKCITANVTCCSISVCEEDC